MESLLAARAGADGVEKFKAGYEKKTKRPAEQVNAALALVGRASEDLAFYEAMYQQLVSVHPLGETDLQALAQRRGDAVAKALVEDAGLSKERIRVDKIAISTDDKSQKVETKLILDASASFSKSVSGSTGAR